MSTELKTNSEFKQWLVDLKTRIRQSQLRAAVKVNSELLRLYWDLGHDIVVRQMDTVWGSGFFDQLSKELMTEFPYMKGFSRSNLYFVKQFYLFYNQDITIVHQAGGQLEGAIVQQAVGKLGDPNFQQAVGELEGTNFYQAGRELEGAIVYQAGRQLQDVENNEDTIGEDFYNHPIFQIPWRHHVQLFTKCKSVHEALFYVQKTIENGWSRAMLMNFMEVDLYRSQGKALNNFDSLLPEVQSDLAKETLKDSYIFDFLVLTERYKEHELEDALTANITRFLLELGKGFAYVGRQVHVQVGSKDLFIDMLFYHLKLRCYIAVELKSCEFEAAFTGQLGVYVSAVNHLLRTEADNPTLGLLICKTKDNLLAQYSLESSSQPIGISEYHLSKLLPENFKSSLPSIEEIEQVLNDKK